MASKNYKTSKTLAFGATGLAVIIGLGLFLYTRSGSKNADLTQPHGVAGAPYAQNETAQAKNTTENSGGDVGKIGASSPHNQAGNPTLGTPSGVASNHTGPEIAMIAPQNGTQSSNTSTLGTAPLGPNNQNKIAEPAKAIEPAATCFSLAFHHKQTVGHGDNEACTQHRNLIHLKHAQVNPKSICVRVDGVPVRFQVVSDKNSKANTSLSVAPLAGPTSRITARYCINKVNCTEECKLPKDEFMEAIGGDDEAIAANAKRVPAGKSAQWDPNDKEKDTDVSAELEADIQKELAENNGLSTFEGWIEDSQTVACNATKM